MVKKGSDQFSAGLIADSILRLEKTSRDIIIRIKDLTEYVQGALQARTAPERHIRAFDGRRSRDRQARGSHQAHQAQVRGGRGRATVLSRARG